MSGSVSAVVDLTRLRPVPQRMSTQLARQSTLLSWPPLCSGDQIEPDATNQASADFEALAAATMNSLLEAGNAIIDPSATSTVGSVDAMTKINSINKGPGLYREIQIGPTERPSFRFGNNGRTTCLSIRPSCQFLCMEV